MDTLQNEIFMTGLDILKELYIKLMKKFFVEHALATEEQRVEDLIVDNV